MGDLSENNKRIAKNTIFLYIRMLVVMGVTLYTTRVVLEALGTDDYAIYMVVGGLSASFIFFQSALTNATQRFLNFEIGASNEHKLNKIFCLSFLIYGVIALLVLVVGGILGTWYIHKEMVIPADRIVAAEVTLWAMLLSLLTTFVGAVYEAVLIAREKMNIYAYLGLFDAASKLMVALALLHTAADRLIAYAVLLAAMQILSKLVLIWYCRRQFSETRLSFYWNRALFGEMFAFAGWNIFGTAAWAVNEQGITLLINKFFTLAVNTARGITWQVSAAINNLSSNFFTAMRPQMIQSYASGDHSRFSWLIYSGSRYSVFLMWMLCLPVMLRTRELLGIWLVSVPELTAQFVRWSLVYSMVNVLTNPLWCAVQAVGRLKTTIIYGSSFFLLAFPISWILIRHGAPAVVTYQVMTVIRAGYVAICFMILKGYVSVLSTPHYLIRAIVPSLLVCGVSGILMSCVNGWIPDSFIGLVVTCMISVAVTAITIFSIGLNSKERSFILSKIKRK